MRRREFLSTLVGAGAVWPLAGASTAANGPVIGFMSSLTAADRPHVMTAFHKGLNEAGYVEGQNVTIVYRWAAGEYEKLPAMAAELVNRQVSVLAAISGTPTALAAKAATKTIPIVFAIGGDPVAPGLVSSLNRPVGNVTGVTFFTAPLATKRLQLVRDLVPAPRTIAILINPKNPPSISEGKNIQTAALAIGQQIRTLEASAEHDIDASFEVIAKDRIGALFVSADPFFLNNRTKLIALSVRSVVPAIYAEREYVDAGGLISYGASRSDAYRQAGRYVGQILKGAKPNELPIVFPTRFELVINLKTAKALGLEVPLHLQQLADEVIE